MTRYVTRYTVTGVRRERSADGTHTHVVGVYAGEHYFPRQHVIRSINLLNDWVARSAGRELPILVVDACPHEDCTETPYLLASNGETNADGMDSLPAVLSESEAS